MATTARKKRKPQQVPLQAIHIPKLADGYVGRVIDRELERLVIDLDKRGHDGKARELEMKLFFIRGNDGRVKIQYKVKAKVPAYQPEDTIAKLDMEAGGLFFSPDCSENPDQLTLELEEDPVELPDDGEVK